MILPKAISAAVKLPCAITVSWPDALLHTSFMISPGWTSMLSPSGSVISKVGIASWVTSSACGSGASVVPVSVSDPLSKSGVVGVEGAWVSMVTVRLSVDSALPSVSKVLAVKV